MKFIFPQNYNFNSKILGIIDYSTAIVDSIWGMLLLIIVNVFFKSLSIKAFIFIILFIPVLILSIVGINGENIMYVAIYFFKYITSQKIFLYKHYMTNEKISLQKRKKSYIMSIMTFWR